ncbi:MAG: hypothetical protein HY752_00210 [Nitrospirae bacterium]|nr:hypothetical protein [Nitrospirota bacterium]
MKDKFLFYLGVAYAFVFSILVLLAIISLHANIRAIVLLITFMSVLVTHVIISLNIDASKTNKKFFYLSWLWGVKFTVFVINEGLNFFFLKEILILDWIDLFLLHIIALLVSVSFLMKNPFWYIKTENKSYIMVGVAGLIFSCLTTLIVILALIDYIKV